MDQEQVIGHWLIESADSEPTVDGVLVCQARDGEPVVSLRTLKDFLENGA